VVQYKDAPENQIPECTDAELWVGDPQFKYYADPAKMARSTRNFDTLSEARIFQADKGGKGIIKTIPAVPKRCAYCEAFSICSQKEKYNFS
jgi:hypothetical protein